MQHSFDIEIAEKYGISESILLQHLWFWIEKNKANEKNFYDGTYWTYNSTKAFVKLFPYMTQRQIQNALKRLKDKGIIKTGNYNKSAYDRTLWYAFTELGKSIMQKCKMENTDLSNGLYENVTPIPDINTNINANTNTDDIYSENMQLIESGNKIPKNIKDDLKNEFETLWKEYPNKQGKEKAFKSYVKVRTKEKVDLSDIVNGLKRYLVYCKQNQDWYSPKNGSTWFNQKCWEDEYDIKEITTKDIAQMMTFDKFR